MALVNGMEAILVVHLGDERSRRFYDSLTALQLNSFKAIIDWHNPSDLYKVQAYVNDLHYPCSNDFPWVLVHLPWTHFNYAGKWQPLWVDGEQNGWHKEDQMTLIRPKDESLEHFTYAAINETASNLEEILEVNAGKWTYEAVQSAAMDSMVEAIIENVMMSESYKLDYLKMKFALDATISAEAAAILNTCTTIRLMQVWVYRLSQEGKLRISQKVIDEVKEHTQVALDETVTLSIPPEPVALPVDHYNHMKKEATKLIVGEE